VDPWIPSSLMNPKLPGDVGVGAREDRGQAPAGTGAKVGCGLRTNKQGEAPG